MSTAAHEPRRVGPRRADSPSGSTVTPRRNTPETSEPNGMQYDSDELPVLIRLPDLSDLGAAEQPLAPRNQKKHSLSDHSSVGTRKASQQNVSKTRQNSISQHAGHNKLVLGGIAGGILVVVMLLLFNSRSSEQPTDQDGWASEAAELETLVEEPPFTLAAESEPPPLYDEARDTQAAQFASGEFENAPIVPYSNEPQVPRQSETAALPNKSPAAAGWPSDEAMGLQSPAGSAPTSLWPSDSLSLEQSGYEYPSANSPSQTDNRSSMYPSQTESFRMGKLNSDRPLATERDRSNILDGTIETPDTRSLR